MTEIYLIQWIDAHVPDIGWHTKDQMLRELEYGFEITTVGILLAEDENYIALVQNIDKDNEKMSNMIVIPQGCIREKIKLQ